MINDIILFFFFLFVKRIVKKYAILVHMIQDISPHQLNNRFRPDSIPSADSVVLLFEDDRVLLCGAEDVLRLPRFGDLREEVAPEHLRFLLTLDEEAWFLYAGTENGTDVLKAPASVLSVQDIRRRGLFARHIAFALLTSHHLYRWYRDNRYCGACAQAMRPAEKERALKCPACGLTVYPRIMPAVIVGVTKGDEIVLTRYANRPISYHALVAGFNEIGETLEDTVRREVMEEVGLRVKNIRYYKSQPWAVAGDILSGFFCDVDGDPTIRMDRDELKEAVWVRREDVDGQPDDYSLTNEMMLLFRDGAEPKALPKEERKETT